MSQKVIVTLIKKMLVWKSGTPDASRIERDTFEGEAFESEPGAPNLDIKTKEYGTLSFSWTNIAGVQWGSP